MALLDPPGAMPGSARARVLAALLCAGLLLILARLWYLQVARGPELLRVSELNRSRLIRRVPPRGLIEDRRGGILATNTQRIVLSVVPNEARKHRDVLHTLAGLLGISFADLEAVLQDNEVSPFDPVRVATDLDMSTATRIEELRADLPGVVLGPEPVRTYPDGPVCGHLLGQMGQVSRDDLRERSSVGYRPGDYCGKLGIERSYDAFLRGTDGGTKVEVDARGRVRRQLDDADPVPGATLRLTVDRGVQRVAYDTLAALAGKGKPGAAVALDPETGAVLALVSVPSYDPNDFVTGVSNRVWAKLRDDPRKPLINRAVAAATAPGSTFKVITASAGLDSGLITPAETVYCSGMIRLGRWPKRCHKHSGHGSVSMVRAIAASCDVFFYRLGQRLGPDTLASYARRFGLGQETGIDLPGVEQGGIVPTPKWKAEHGMGPWVGGETVDYAIGQAMLACTPLQMANVTAAIANGGTLYRPQVVDRITRYDVGKRPQVVRTLKPEVIGSLGLHPATLAVVREGMRAVVRPGGTASQSALPGIVMAGKTGTAQRRRRGHMVNNAWFIGYAPVERPRIAVCVFVEEGGHGGAVAAPIARKMIARYLGVTPDARGGFVSTD